MIIDFHTHTYPDEIAHRAIDKLAKSTDIFNYTDGTQASLLGSQAHAGIDLSILLPVVTKPSQAATINSIAADINERSRELHLYSFAGIHPADPDWQNTMQSIINAGFKGIKLHPMFQEMDIDNDCYIRIIDMAVNAGLLVMIHGGGDINYPNDSYAAPVREARMLDILGNPDGIILAHMGGWHDWDEVIDALGGRNVYLDTSSCLSHLLTYEGKKVPGKYREPLSDSLFREFVDVFGADHILFGSDSPWGGQRESLSALDSCGLDERELRLIRGENAARLLHL